MNIFANLDISNTKPTDKEYDINVLSEFLNDDFELIEKKIDESDININNTIKELVLFYDLNLNASDFKNEKIKELSQLLFDIPKDQISLEGLMSFAKSGIDKIKEFAGRTWFFLKKYYLESVANFKKSEIALNELSNKISKKDLDKEKFLGKKVKLITKKEFIQALDLYRTILSETNSIMGISDFDKKINSSLHISGIKDANKAISKFIDDGKSTESAKKDMTEAFSSFLTAILGIINKAVKPTDYNRLFGLKVRKSKGATTADVLQFGIPEIFKIKHGSSTVAGIEYDESSFFELKKKLVDVYPDYNVIKSIYEKLEKDYYALSDVASIASKLNKQGNTKEGNLIVRYLLYKKMTLDAKKMTISKPISNLKRLTKQLFKLGYIQLSIK